MSGLLADPTKVRIVLPNGNVHEVHSDVAAYITSLGGHVSVPKLPLDTILEASFGKDPKGALLPKRPS